MMRPRLVWLTLLALFPVAVMGAEAASETAAESAQTDSLSVEEILTTPASGEGGYAEAPRCISTTRIRQVHVLDERNVAFEMSRDSYYLVQFAMRCPMLERDSPIFYEADGQLCRLDAIRPMLGVGATARMGPPCQIPEFRALTREQFLQVREALKAARRGPALVEPPEQEDETR